MKKILGAFLALALSLSVMYADAIVKKGSAGKLDVEYSSAKSLTVGVNKIVIKVKDGGKEVSDAKVNMVVSMPAMPGMMAMEEKADAPYKNGAYEANIEFSMRGTWQVSIVIETKDGVKQRLKSSVIL